MEAATSTGSKTIAGLIPRAAAEFGDRRGDPLQARRRPGTTSATPQLGEIVQEIGHGLIDLGLEPGERICILGNTRPEWTYADMAATSAGSTVVPIYQTNSPEECLWVISDSEACAIVVENDEQLQKIAAIRDQVPNIRTVIVMDPPAGAAGNGSGPELPLGAIPLEEVRERGARPLAGGARSAPRRRQAGGPLHVHLHLGHDRPAEGLRAHATATTARSSTWSARPARSRATRSSTSTCRSPTPSRC